MPKGHYTIIAKGAIVQKHRAKRSAMWAAQINELALELER